MAGLLSTANLQSAATGGPVDAAPTDQQTQPQSTTDLGKRTLDDNEPNASPEEQKQYDEFVKNGYLLIYAAEGKVRPQIIALLDTDPSDLKDELPPEAFAKISEHFNPVSALAGATVRLVLQLVADAKNAGTEISDDVIFQGGKALLEDLVMVAQGEKLHDYSQEDVNQAAILGAAMYYAAAKERGWVDDEPLKEQFAQVQDAAQQGPDAVHKLFAPDGSAATDPQAPPADQPAQPPQQPGA